MRSNEPPAAGGGVTGGTVGVTVAGSAPAGAVDVDAVDVGSVLVDSGAVGAVPGWCWASGGIETVPGVEMVLGVIPRTGSFATVDAAPCCSFAQGVSADGAAPAAAAAAPNATTPAAMP